MPRKRSIAYQVPQSRSSRERARRDKIASIITRPSTPARVALIGKFINGIGHEQTSRHVRVMSVLPLKADIHQRGLRVRFVP